MDKLNLAVPLLKSLALLLMYLAITVALSIFMYSQWHAITNIGWPLFLVAEAAVIAVAYKIGMLPAAKDFFKKKVAE